MRRAAALKAWATRRANGWKPKDKNGISMPLKSYSYEPGRLADYARLRTGQLFTFLKAEQRILESFANHPGRGGFARDVEGSGWGAVAVITGGTFAGGRATLMAQHTARRLHRIECELETRGFDRETLDDHRFGDEATLAERVGLMDEDGDTDFYIEELSA